ncbi:MAG: 30S ribosome-binding factor RbfA [Bryobacter sp.]
MEGHRYERVAESIREEIVELIAYGLEDNRLEGLEVVDVQVSPDMKKAMISVLTPHQGEEQEKVLQLLRNAKGYLRNELAQRVDLYRTPELYFDAALDLGPKRRVQKLLKRVQRGRLKEDV